MQHTHALDATACIQPGQRVFIHGAAATPRALIDGLVAHAGRLSDVELVHIHTEGAATWASPDHRGAFRVANLFVGHNMRPLIDGDRVDYVPCFLSEIPQLFQSGRRPIDVALISVSPPGPHGFCTLGPSVDVTLAAVKAAKIVIAEVNQQMPRVAGDGLVHQSQIDHWIATDRPLPEAAPHALDAVHRAIGENVAAIVEDGATLQLGIGAVPDAVLAALSHHRHLGVHSEMFSDGLLPLLERGTVDNSRKAHHPGKTVASFVMGTRALYDHIDQNPSVELHNAAYVNDVATIFRNPKVTAINSALAVDLSGQICADSLGHRIISGVGGQMDFIRGASLSKGGKPIIALPSRTRRGERRIVTTLRPGSGVVTTRAHVQLVATEYGCVDLYGRTINERARLLISIAHPDDREDLAREWRDAR